MEFKNGKQYSDEFLTKIGVGLLAVAITGILLITFYWDKEASEGLSCIGVRSNINNLIDEATSYKEKGITNTKKNIILDKLDQSLTNNKRLNCGFNKHSIMKKFNHLDRD